MVVWQRINETLAIFAWPAAVVVVLVVFRAPLGRLLGRVKSLEVAGNTISIEQEVTTAVNSDLTTAPDQGVDMPPETSPGAATDRTDDGTGADSGPLASTKPQVSREVVEDVARTFARAGWRLGASGEYADPPEPRLDWGGDGRLILSGWSGVKSRASSPPAALRGDPVMRLEKEIRELDLKIKSRTNMGGLAALGSTGPDGERAQLQELRDRLRAIDPSSPWAW